MLCNARQLSHSASLLRFPSLPAALAEAGLEVAFKVTDRSLAGEVETFVNFGGGGRDICKFGGGGTDICQDGHRYTLGDGTPSC